MWMLRRQVEYLFLVDAAGNGIYFTAGALEERGFPSKVLWSPRPDGRYTVEWLPAKP